MFKKLRPLIAVLCAVMCFCFAACDETSDNNNNNNNNDDGGSVVEAQLETVISATKAHINDKTKPLKITQDTVGTGGAMSMSVTFVGAAVKMSRNDGTQTVDNYYAESGGVYEYYEPDGEGGYTKEPIEASEVIKRTDFIKSIDYIQSIGAMTTVSGSIYTVKTDQIKAAFKLYLMKVHGYAEAQAQQMADDNLVSASIHFSVANGKVSEFSLSQELNTQGSIATTATAAFNYDESLTITLPEAVETVPDGGGDEGDGALTDAQFDAVITDTKAYINDKTKLFGMKAETIGIQDGVTVLNAVAKTKLLGDIVYQEVTDDNGNEQEYYISGEGDEIYYYTKSEGKWKKELRGTSVRDVVAQFRLEATDMVEFIDSVFAFCAYEGGKYVLNAEYAAEFRIAFAAWYSEMNAGRKLPDTVGIEDFYFTVSGGKIGSMYIESLTESDDSTVLSKATYTLTYDETATITLPTVEVSIG